MDQLRQSDLSLDYASGSITFVKDKKYHNLLQSIGYKTSRDSERTFGKRLAPTKILCISQYEFMK